MRRLAWLNRFEQSWGRNLRSLIVAQIPRKDQFALRILRPGPIRGGLERAASGLIEASEEIGPANRLRVDRGPEFGIAALQHWKSPFGFSKLFPFNCHNAEELQPRRLQTTCDVSPRGKTVSDSMPNSSSAKKALRQNAKAAVEKPDPAVEPANGCEEVPRCGSRGRRRSRAGFAANCCEEARPGGGPRT